MSTIQDFIDQVAAQDFAKAGPMFNDLLNAKLTDALDAEKIKLANQIYNGGEQLELDLEEPEDGVEEDDDESLDDEEEETEQ